MVSHILDKFLNSSQLGNPYKGPKAFERGDVLYGREFEVGRLCNRLAAQRIMLLYGASGVGKTSTIQAGLVPKLEQRSYRALKVGSLRPREFDKEVSSGRDNHFVKSLLIELESQISGDKQNEMNDLFELTIAGYLERRLGLGCSSQRRNTVLIFDQFEELINESSMDYSDEEARLKYEFFSELGDALHNRRLWALFSMREEYIAALDPYLHLIPTRLNSRLRLEPLDLDEAREAIEAPAKNVGVSYTSRALDHLLNDLRKIRVTHLNKEPEYIVGPDVEPLYLQVACRVLWDRVRYRLARNRYRIKLNHVRDLSDVDAALSDHYCRQVEKAVESFQLDERFVRQWFEEHLITDQDTRGWVLKGEDDSAGLNNKAVDLFETSYLLRPDTQRRATWYELSHDRLIEPIQESNLNWRINNPTEFQRSAQLWNNRGRPQALLLSAAEIEREAEKARQENVVHSLIERAFLNQSKKRCERKKKRKLTRRYQRTAWWSALLFLVTLVLILAYFHRSMDIQRGKNEQVKQAVIANNLAITAQFEMDENPDLAVILATHAVALTDRIASGDENNLKPAIDPKGVLLQAIRRLKEQAPLSLNGAIVTSVESNPDGSLIGVSYDSGIVKFWSVDKRREEKAIHAHNSQISDTAFNEDGSLFITAGADQTAKIWDLSQSENEEIRELPHESAVTSVSFGPKGLIATATVKGQIRLWNLALDEEPVSTVGYGKPIWALDFAPDGSRLAAAVGKGAMRIWNLEGDQPRDAKLSIRSRKIKAHRAEVFDVLFSPDGTKIVTAARDDEVKIWKINDLEDPMTLRGHAETVLSASFEERGFYLATAAADGTVKVWNTSTGQLVRTLKGHTVPVSALDFIARDTEEDPMYLVSGDTAGRLMLWNLALAHTNRVNVLAFNENGSRYVTASADSTAKVWDTESGRVLLSLRGHSGDHDLTDVSYGRSDNLIATASEDHTVIIWDAASGKRLYVLQHSSPVWSVTFNADGSRIVTSDSQDRTAKLWDSETGNLLKVFGDGHEHDVTDATINSNATKVATASLDRSAIIWDTKTQEPSIPPLEHESAVMSIAFNPDSDLLVTGTINARVFLWDVESGKEEETFEFDGPIRKVGFSSDGTQAFASSSDGTLRIWDVATKTEILTLGYESAVSDIDIDNGSETLAVVTRANRPFLYDLNIERSIKEIQNELRSFREDGKLNSDECFRYFFGNCPPSPFVAQ